jgi:thioester reductase-like protein
MSVPSIMEDVVNLEVSQRKMALSSLANLKYVAIGGGPLKPSVGKILHDASVNLLNHYGATEIGAIAPIFVPSSDYDWRYLRLRGDLGLELQPISDSPGAPDKLRYKLVGYPFGWKSAFELQDEIEKRPLNQTEHTDIRVLKTGEKISPRSIEDSLVLDPNIKSAVCLGEGFFELILLVEPSASSLMDAKDFRNHVWNLLSAISPTLDSHSRISSIEGIVIKDGEKTIPRSDKGSIMRKEVHKLFEREIEEAYKRLEAAAIGGEIHVDASSVEGTLAATIEVIMGTKLQSLPLSPDQDFFELGMDSLEAARLARALTFVLPPLGFQRDVQITKEFVYKYPTISKLAQVCHDMGGSHLDTLIPKVTRRVKIQQLADEYLGNIEADATNIVLTGSSGNLGIHMLSCLLRSPRVHKVVCLGRGGPSAAKALRQRQEAARVAAGIEIKSIEWNKVVNVGANMGTTYLGLAKEQYEEVVASTTHIIHLAWPMDFNRQLESYRPQLESLRGLIRLAVDINRANPIVRPGLLFASSISVVRHYPNLTGQHVIPEISMRNPDVTAHIGYAEAKWICEQMLERVKQKLGHKIDPIVVRIGQLSGPESSRGVWKTEEHIPALLKASQRVAAFPAIGGDFSWLPVDRAAKCLMDIVLRQSSSSCSSPTSTMYLHLENPMRQSFADLGAIATRELSLSGGIVPFDSWLQLLARRGDTPGLLDFFRNDFRDLANGSVKLGMRNGLSVSTSLRSSSGLSQSLMIEYIDRWRQTGFLS